MIPILLDWFWFLLLVVVCGTALWAFVVWWKKDRYTRQRFAFQGFAGLSGFALLYFYSLLAGNSIFGIIANILAKPFGINIPSSPLSPFEAVLIFAVLLVLSYVYLEVFKHWDGLKSIAQHEQEQNNEPLDILKEIHIFIKHSEKLTPYLEQYEQSSNLLERPESLTWHERARQLWILKHRSYLIKSEYDPAYKCWLGEEKNTGAIVLLIYHHEMPQSEEIQKSIKYAHQIVEARKAVGVELIFAVKNGCDDSIPEHPEHKLIFTCESELLKDLVDFSDYFLDVNYRVNHTKLTDSDFTLQDMYTPSLYRSKKDDVNQSETLESFIKHWLNNSTDSHQLAVLGEYGQGKSTTSLLLCYHLIQEKRNNPSVRIPILIELRGKTLRTMPPEELLSIWAGKYRIDPQALLHLHLAGHLLLIFEGFNEIDLSGDTETRIAHFRPLWQLNYENAKIMITGRPNFFLDSNELQLALGNEEHTKTLYLAPFTLQQIEQGLRNVAPKTRTEILALAKKDEKFYEVVSRPALLYIVAILWEREQLSQREHVNSAMVIELFIQQTLRRQQKKHDERAFMILNSAERFYFMMGIAAYMAAKKLPNQITKQQLNEAVSLLIDVIPDAVSRNVSATSRENNTPLRGSARSDWVNHPKEIIDKINNDVRSCGLLITDLSKDGTFKFAHKSYMELLQAKVISELFSEGIHGRSIASIWNLGIHSLQTSNESMSFLAELLMEHLHKQGINEEKVIAKKLWEMLVIGKCLNCYLITTHLVKARELCSYWLANKLLILFGLDRVPVVSLTLFSFMLGLPILTASITVGILRNDYSIVFKGGLFTAALWLVLILALSERVGKLLKFMDRILSGLFDSDKLKYQLNKHVKVRSDFISILESTAARLASMSLKSESQTDAFIFTFATTLASIAIVHAPKEVVFDNALWLTVVHDSLIVLPINIIIFAVVHLLNATRYSTFFGQLEVWYRACVNLKFSHETIEQVVGKGIFSLLVKSEEKRKQA